MWRGELAFFAEDEASFETLPGMYRYYSSLATPNSASSLVWWGELAFFAEDETSFETLPGTCFPAGRCASERLAKVQAMPSLLSVGFELHF